MQLLLAYWGVVIIWSTTPLGIAGSNHSLTFWSAAGLRMILALPLILLIVVIRRRPFIPNRKVALAYLVAAMGFTPQMSLVYWAAQYVPTGVISIVFAFSPCLTYLASLVVLRDSRLVPVQALALVVALAGMGVIYADQLRLGPEAVMGLAALLLSVCLFAVSIVWLKRLTGDMTLDPFCQAGGTMLFAFPVFLVCWLVFDGEVPTAISSRSITAIVYLAIFGSVVGTTLYFYIMRHMSPVTVSLVTLITPLFAMAIGKLFLDEDLTLRMLLGALLVLVALIIFEGLPLRFYRWLRQPAVKEEMGAEGEG